jgi:hypothetical protein
MAAWRHCSIQRRCSSGVVASFITKIVPLRLREVRKITEPFEERSIERSSVWTAGGKYPLRTCCAEDLIIHKCFAGRENDWTDVQGVLIRQHAALDFKLIRTELMPLLDLKGDPEAANRLEKMIQREAL